MTPKNSNSQLTHYFFIFLLFSGSVLLIISFFWNPQGHLFSGLREVSCGILLIGFGEWINHPSQKSVAYEEKKEFIFYRFRHRKRTPSAIGNLFEICGLIGIFTGMADFF